MSERTHNTPSGRELLSYIERIERIEAERADLGEDRKAVYAEAKARGYEPRTIRAIVKRRKLDPGELSEQLGLIDVYWHAIGMADQAPARALVAQLGVDVTAREQIVEALKELVPPGGQIIVSTVGAVPVRIWRNEDGAAHAEDFEREPEPKVAPGRGKSAPVITLASVREERDKQEGEGDDGSDEDDRDLD